MLHCPFESRSFPPAALTDDLACTGLSDLVAAMIATLTAETAGTDADRLAGIGAVLQEWTSRSPSSFRDVVYAALARSRTRYLNHLYQLGETRKWTPAWWAEDVRRQIAQTEAALSVVEFPAIADCPSLNADADVRCRQVATLVRRFGEAVAAWPALCEAAASVEPAAEGAGWWAAT